MFSITELKIFRFLPICPLFFISLSYAAPVSVRASHIAELPNQQNVVTPMQVNNTGMVNVSTSEQNAPSSQRHTTTVVDSADVWASASVEMYHDKQFVSLPSPKRPILVAVPQVEKPIVKKSVSYAPIGSYKVVSLPRNNKIANGAMNYVVTSKPRTLSRRQILEQEIHQEQKALNAALIQFTAAKKVNNEALAQKILMKITDRRLNLRALQAELRRY